jgi:hypothetical protein
MTDEFYSTTSETVLQVDQHVGEWLSGYLDGELTQQQRQKVDIHLGSCESCRKNLEDLENLRTKMGAAQLSNMNQDQWREMMDDTTVQVSRGFGWILFVGALLILAGIGIYEFVIDSSIELTMKLLISAVYLGLGALFVSVLRQRLIERKSDKYKDVEI